MGRVPNVGHLALRTVGHHKLPIMNECSTYVPESASEGLQR